MINNKLSNKGFTLIELLITISVITVGIIGAFTAIQQGISTVDYSRSRLTSAFLAQEGVEIIKNIRDTNLLERSVLWDEDLAPGEYEVVYDDVQGFSPGLFACVSPCSSSTLNFLKKTDNGFYNYVLGDDTIYKRKVRIERISNEHLRVSVKVYWRTKKGYKEFEIMQEMYKWW